MKNKTCIFCNKKSLNDIELCENHSKCNDCGNQWRSLHQAQTCNMIAGKSICDECHESPYICFHCNGTGEDCSSGLDCNFCNGLGQELENYGTDNILDQELYASSFDKACFYYMDKKMDPEENPFDGDDDDGFDYSDY